MTVNVEIPVVQYLGNGATIDYTFKWSCGAADENYIIQDSVLLTEGIQYELEDFTEEFGGTMVFNIAPLAGSAITIFRRTPITQQVDYVEGDPFPADTHEFQLDKDTRILQELYFGVIGTGGVVDLASVPHETYVEITNTSGTGADIEPWTTDGLLAGVFLGEVVPFGGSAPLDGNPTDKTDGYVWWLLEAAAAAGGDATIVMFTSQITVATEILGPAPASAEFRYDLSGAIEYGYDKQLPLVAPEWEIETAITPTPTMNNQYWVQFEVVSGGVDGDVTDTWIDAVSMAGNPDEFLSWKCADPGLNTSVIAKFHVAPDDGGGSPDLTLMITRFVVMDAEQI